MKNGYLNVALGAITSALTWQTAGYIMSFLVGLVTFFYFIGCIRFKILEIRKITRELEKQDDER